jgi:hypothetical protein
MATAIRTGTPTPMDTRTNIKRLKKPGAKEETKRRNVCR